MAVEQLEYLDAWTWENGVGSQRWTGVVDDILALRDSSTPLAPGDRLVVHLADGWDAREPLATATEPIRRAKLFLATDLEDPDPDDVWHATVVLSEDGGLLWPTVDRWPQEEHQALIRWMGGTYTDDGLVAFVRAAYASNRAPELDNDG